MRVALIGRDGRVHHRIARRTRADEGRARVVDRFVGMLRRTASSIATESPVGVGLSLASPVEPETGVMRNPPNLPGWDGYTLKPVLEQSLSLRVSAGNDATLAALAEHRYGAGRPYSHFVYMTLSTGIGGGLILDGKPYTGAGGYAGEVGHVTIDRSGPVCGCGNVGCLEALASGTAVARLIRERLAAGQPATLLGDEEDGPDSERVFQAARLGDPLAKAGGAGGRCEPGSRDSQPAERLRSSGLRHRRGHVGKPRPPSASRGPRDRPARHGPPP